MSIASPTIESGQRFLLPDVSWEFYERLLAELGDRPLRVTYDRGDLEMMSPSHRHERYGRLLGDLIVVLAEELKWRLIRGGSTTFRREDLDRGLEPDDCFWIQNVDAVLSKEEIDLSIDPPPDLALEIDITRSSLNRMGIYAALGVPEVWRYDRDSLTVYRRTTDNAYETESSSRIFPNLPMDRVIDFLGLAGQTDNISLYASFREWVRSEVLPQSPGE